MLMLLILMEVSTGLLFHMKIQVLRLAVSNPEYLR